MNCGKFTEGKPTSGVTCPSTTGDFAHLELLGDAAVLGGVELGEHDGRILLCQQARRLGVLRGQGWEGGG